MKNAEDANQETIFIAVLVVLLIQQEPQSSPESRKMVMYIPAAWLHQDSLVLVGKVWHGMQVQFVSHELPSLVSDALQLERCLILLYIFNT
jgi:hypothetical protein